MNASAHRHRLPTSVERLLARVRLRLRLLGALEGGAVAFGLGAMLFVVALALDRFLFLDEPTRHAISLTVACAGIALVLAFVVRPLVRSRSRRSIAQLIEARVPRFRGALWSVVEFDDELRGRRKRLGTGSPELLDRLAALTGAESRDVRTSDCVPFRGRARVAAWATLGTLALVLAIAPDPAGFAVLVQRFVDPSAAIVRPSTVKIEVIPGTRRIRRGDGVDIVVNVTKGSPASASIYIDDSNANEDPRADPEDAVLSFVREDARTFRARLESVTRLTRYKVRAGDAETPYFVLEPADPPRAIGFLVHFRYPDYTHLPERSAEQARGDLEAVRGTRADLIVEASAPIAKGKLESSEAADVAGKAESSRVRFEGLSIDEDASYRLILTGVDGLESARPESISIRALEDEPPSVRLLSPAADEILVETRSRLELTVRAEDDLGLRKLELRIDPEGATSSTGSSTTALLANDASVPETGPGPRFLEEDVALRIEDLELGGADRARIVLRAVDGLGQEAVEDVAHLRIQWVPLAPEGERWSEDLAQLRSELALLRDEWRRVAPDPESGSASPASGQSLILEAAARAEEVARAAVDLAARARAGGPERRLLEHSAQALLRIALDDALGIWIGGPRALAAARKSTERLASLETAFESFELLDSLERILDLNHELERSVTSVDPDDPARDRAPEERLARWLEEGERIDADIERLVTRDPRRMPLVYWMRAWRSTVLDELRATENVLERSAPPREFKAARARLALALARRAETLREEVDRVAREWERARRQVASLPRTSDRLEGLARSLRNLEKAREKGDTSALAAEIAEVRGLFRSLETELDLAIEASRSYVREDPQAIDVLAATRDLIAKLALEVERRLDGNAGDSASIEDLASTAGRISGAFEATRKFRRAGKKLQDIDYAAQALDEVGRQLAGASRWNERALRLSARTSRGTARTLADVEGDLTALEGLPTVDATRDALAAAIVRIDTSSRALAGGPAGIGSVAIESSGRANRDASLALDRARDGLEEAYAELAAAARDSIRWLRERRGSELDRIERLADRQREILAGIDAGEDGGVDPLALAHGEAELRSIAAQLGAELVRPEPPRLSRGLEAPSPPPLAPEDREHAGRAVLRVRDDAMLETERALAQWSSLDGAEAGAWLERARNEAGRAARDLKEIVESLAVLSLEALRELEGGDVSSDLERAEDLAGTAGGLDEIRALAERFLAACETAGEALRDELSHGPSRDRLLEQLAEAGSAFALAVNHAAKGDEKSARERLDTGVALFRAAIEIARELRGEAARSLAERAESSRENDRRDANEKEESERPEIDDLQREIEELLARRRALADVDRLLAELLARDGSPSPEDLERLAKAQEELAGALEKKHLGEEELVALVAELLQIERATEAIAEEQRFLEEETRRRVALHRELGAAAIETEVARRTAAGAIVARLSRAGTELSAVLPLLHQSFIDARAQGARWLDALDALPAALTAVPPEPEAVARANLELGLFLRHVEEAREEALDVLAARRSGAGRPSGDAAFGRAAQALREAASLARRGQLADAGGRVGTARLALAGATSSLERRLAGLVAASAGIKLPGAVDGAGGLSTWRAEVRTDEAEATSERAVERWERMSYPERYRAIVEPYLRLLER